MTDAGKHAAVPPPGSADSLSAPVPGVIALSARVRA